MESYPVDYLPILLQVIFAVLFAVVTLFFAFRIGPRISGKEKGKPFESGIKVVGNARQPFAIKYFLVAILFILFDIEVVFMYPWAVNFKELGMLGLVEMFTFIGLLLVGYIYIIKSKALEWD